MRGASPLLSLTDLIGGGVSIHQFRSPRARDAVFVARLDDGGMISYRCGDDAWRHTLCTREGFKRKLEQLAIILPDLAV